MTVSLEQQQGGPVLGEPLAHGQASSGLSQPRMVVGIGASAGGIQALQQLLAHMPADTDMAFIIVLHRPPQRKSQLAAILQGSTSLPVTQLTDALPIAPNHVYIIPPANHLVIAGDELQIGTSEQGPGQRAPIDRLFSTLADTYGTRAAGIVLSGMGTNGTLGIKRIKERGGLTLAQDPQDAEYDSMPRSAIATRLVDRIAPASQLPEALIAYSQHGSTIEPDMRPATEPSQENDTDTLDTILALLYARTGIDFSIYQRRLLINRIVHRMQVVGAADLASYGQRLQAQPDEREAIAHELLLRPSSFFHDRAAISALAAGVVPKLFAHKSSGDTVRVWVPGCMSGEEAYTIAILLREYQARRKTRPAIQLFATDIDGQAIATARMGRYPTAIASEISPARLRRFFVRERGYYRVTSELRNTIIFAQHNLAADAPFGRLDLIACRYLLDDLAPAARGRALDAFHFALLPDGYLWLGAAAAWAVEGGLFRLYDEAHGLFVPQRASRQIPAPLISTTNGLAIPADGQAAQADRSALVRTLHQQLLERYAPPSVLLTPLYEIVRVSAGAGRLLRFAEGQLSSNILELAPPELQPALRATLEQARSSGTIARATNLAVAIDGAIQRMNLLVQPVQTPTWAHGYLLVLFEQIHDTTPQDAPPTTASATQSLQDQLAAALRGVQEHLQRTTEQAAFESEQLRTANEELQTSNEELRARSTDLAATQATLQAEMAERHRIELELATRIHQQAAVAALSQQALAKNDLDHFLSDAVALVARTLHVEYCAVLERLHDGQGLRVRAGFGWHTGVVGQVMAGTEPTTQAGYILASGAPMLIEDLRTERRFQPPPMLLEHGVVSCMSVQIANDHGPFGMLGAHTTQRRTFTPDEVQFLQAIANLLAAAIARRRLEAARQQLLLRFDSVREEEQRQIARELHDQLGQYLTGLRLGLTLLGDAAPLSAAAAAQLQRAQDIVEHIGGEVRHLVLELRPISLDEQGLLATLRNYIADWSKQAQVVVDLHSRGLDKLRLPPQLETTIYRVVQEALTNVLRHARAHSVSLILERRVDHVQVVVEDDGRGFDVEAVLRSPNVEQRLGLLGMQERAAMVGGVLTIESSPGRGTSLFLRVPYTQEGTDGTYK